MIRISIQRGSRTERVAASGAGARRKRGRIFKLSLAGLALVGVGAAATSAAWTDDAWFSATATTPTIQLQGGIGASPTAWSNADPSSNPAVVTIPSTAFANLQPGVAAVVHLGLKNISTVPLIVGQPTATWSGDFASGSCSLAGSPLTTVTVNGGTNPVTLPANNGQTTDVIVTVTPPSTWNGAATCQGKSGSLTLTFTGSTS